MSCHQPEEVVHYDEDGKPYVRDEFGNKIPPMQTKEARRSSGFTTYNSGQGHCPLCGSLTCRGQCFK